MLGREWQSSAPAYVVSRECGWQSSDPAPLSAPTSKTPSSPPVPLPMLMALFYENLVVIAIANTMAELFADSVPCNCGPVPELLASRPLCRLKCAHLMDV